MSEIKGEAKRIKKRARLKCESENLNKAENETVGETA